MLLMYTPQQLSEYYSLTFMLNSGLFLSLLDNWQADQLTCTIHTPTFERGNYGENCAYYNQISRYATVIYLLN